ncbi:MAG: cysteine dioxygenase family protein [Candidatus Didemnitutus sp.]|nr:cysteine dioxygenase family protein [Candidatus Didemnitutus sp.]
MSSVAQTPPPVLAPLLSYLHALKTERADLGELSRLLTESAVTLEDLKGYLHFEDDCYRRNLVAENPWFNLLVLCWKSGQRSPIHDHAHSVCAFKVLTGVCSETVYAFSPCGQVVPVQTTDLPAGKIVASHDSETHQVSNLQPAGTNLVTLHIYSPPLKTMRVFSLTGKSGGEWLAPEHKAIGA